MNDFQERLDDLLREKSYNNLKLAHEIGVSHETISGYFNRNLYPELSIAKRMATFFNCSLDYLLGLSDKRKNGDKNNLTVFKTVEKLIKDKKISIAKAMREMNISEYNYFRWKKGTKPLTSMLIILAKYFDVSVDYLVGCCDEK